jgi:hypothetical protein
MIQDHPMTQDHLPVILVDVIQVEAVEEINVNIYNR